MAISSHIELVFSAQLKHFSSVQISMIQDEEGAADCVVWPGLGSAGILIVPRQMAAGARPGS